MKKNILIVVCALVLVIFIIVGIVLIAKDDEPELVETPKQKEIVKRDLTEEEHNSLIKRINELKRLDYLDKSFKPIELSNQEVLQFASTLVNMDGVEFSKLEEIAKNYLDFSLEPENLICMTHFNKLGTSDNIYLYDTDTGKFVKNTNHISHKETGYYSNIYNFAVDQGRLEDNKYILKVYKVFSDTDSKHNYYKSYGDAVAEKGVLSIGTNSLNENDIKKYVNDLKIYTYTFELKDNNYVLVNYEIGE